jgi:hypothetical protein
MRLAISDPQGFALTCLDQRMISTVRQVEGLTHDINQIVCKATTSAIPERPSVFGRSSAVREDDFPDETWGLITQGSGRFSRGLICNLASYHRLMRNASRWCGGIHPRHSLMGLNEAAFAACEERAR